MSFILDALKKSEEERRKGEVPGLRDEPLSPVARRQPLWLVLLAVALLLNGALLGWWMINGGPSGEEGPGVVEATMPGRDATPPPTASDMPTPRTQAPQPAPVIPRKHETPVAEARPPAAPGGAGAAAERIPPTRPEKALAQPAEVTAPAGREPTVADPSAVREQAASISEGSAAGEETVSGTPNRSAETGFPLLEDLDSATRARLPEIRLQLHFYIDEPGRRMVRINGVNLREGERTGEGIEVVGIDPEGVRLAWQGARLLLPAER